jgi:alpha-ketoglutarate-dependent taurine dioxygenase
VTIRGGNPNPGPSPGLGEVHRQAIRVSETDLVHAEPLRPEGPIPLVASPSISGVDLVEWGQRHRERIEDWLLVHGAILFRGFEGITVERFERLIAGISGPLVEYQYGSTPRSPVAGNIYTSTEYPAHQEIPLHNEMSYSKEWPRKIWFFCVIAAPEGGQTPIADSRRVFGRIDPSVRDRMVSRGVLYVRNYGEGLDVPWQKVFQTEDREKVEEFCRTAGIQWEWRGENGLRTREVCQAAATHPVTGERVWFNQAHLFHVSNIEARTREQLLSMYGPDELPRNAFYGDGSPLEDATLAEIRAAYDSEEIVFPWQSGDLLMVDNMLVAHARKPFSGERRVVVGMAEPYRAREGDVR